MLIPQGLRGGLSDGLEHSGLEPTLSVNELARGLRALSKDALSEVYQLINGDSVGAHDSSQSCR